MTFVDPPEPPEGGSQLRAKDLKGKYVILRPTGTGQYEARPAEHDAAGNVVKKAAKASTYVECDVWCFDRAGLDPELQSSGVRVAWWKAVDQLKGLMGEYVACRPTEQDDNSIVLAPLTGQAREDAAKHVASIRADGGVVNTPDDLSEYGEEPF